MTVSRPCPKPTDTNESTKTPVVWLPFWSMVSSTDTAVSIASVDGRASCAEASPTASRTPMTTVVATLRTRQHLLQLQIGERGARRHRAVKRFPHVTVELRPGVPAQFCQRRGRGPCRTIGARTGHRVVRVSHVNDARVEWNLFGAEPERVAESVRPLVVQLDNRQVRGQERHFLEDPRSERRVTLDVLELECGERSGFA